MVPSNVRVVCVCGVTNSAFNPQCLACGAWIDERSTGADRYAEVSDVATSVGRYRLGEVLGSGALGRVFRGELAGAPDVAIKVLHPHLVAQEETRARLLREAKAMQAVKHPSLGRVLEVVGHGRTVALVLELHHGASLRALLSRSAPLEVASIRAVVRQTAEALGALHAAGWIHRDVKPENIMVAAEDLSAPGSVRLHDFGLARSVMPDEQGLQTATGVFVGSLSYASPEQLLGEEVGPATDWWSLGVVIYEALARELPIRGSTKLEIARAIMRARIEPPDAAPEDLKRVVAALLRADPSTRSSHPGDVLALLDDAS